MTVHRSVRELAARSIDAALSQEQLRGLHRHLVDCDACRAYEAGLRSDALALASVQPLQPTESADRRIQAALASTRPMGQLSPVLVLLLTALVVAAAVGGALAVGSFIRQQEDSRLLPQRPDTPAGWTVVTAASADVRLALPPYAAPFDQDTSIMANEDPAGNTTWFQVFAIGPEQAEQPGPGVAPADWLLSYIAGPALGEVTIRNVPLPAGPSVQVRTTYRAGTPEETQALMYAIATADGYAMLQIVGRPEDFANHRADIALIPYLLEAGPMLAADIGPGNAALTFEFEVPDGWHSRPGPASDPRGDDFELFISNAPIPDTICEVDSHGGQSCFPESIPWGPDEFLVSVMVFQGGTPRLDPLSSPLPIGVDLVVVAGQPASRVVDPEVLDGDRVLVVWELHAPGVEFGYWLITMNAGQTNFDAHLAAVQAVLDGARFVDRD